MKIMIQKDSASKLPKVVRDLGEAQAIAANGFHVLVVQENEDGTETEIELADAVAVEVDEPDSGDAPAPKAAAKKPAAKRK